MKSSVILILILILIVPVSAQESITSLLTGEEYYNIIEPQTATETNIPFFQWTGAPEGYSVYDLTEVTFMSADFYVNEIKNGTELTDGLIRFSLHFFRDEDSSEPFASYIALLHLGENKTVHPEWDCDLSWSIDGWGNRSATLKFNSRMFVEADDSWVTWTRITIKTLWQLTYVQSPDPLYPIEIVIILGIAGIIIGLPTACCLIRRKNRKESEKLQEQLQEKRREERKQRKFKQKDKGKTHEELRDWHPQRYY